MWLVGIPQDAILGFNTVNLDLRCGPLKTINLPIKVHMALYKP